MNIKRKIFIVKQQTYYSSITSKEKEIAPVGQIISHC